MLLAAGLLAARRLDVKAVLRAVVGTPYRPSRLLPRITVDWLPVAPGLSAVAVQHINHSV